MILHNQTKKTILAANLEHARTFWPRLVGLLGRNHLAENTALWIERCPSIHTLFMRFAIDVVFVDRSLIVKSCFENVKPWRLVGALGASSVFEVPVGTIRKTQTQPGDQLYVAN